MSINGNACRKVRSINKKSLSDAVPEALLPVRWLKRKQKQ